MVSPFQISKVKMSKYLNKIEAPSVIGKSKLTYEAVVWPRAHGRQVLPIEDGVVLVAVKHLGQHFRNEFQVGQATCC